MRIHTQGFKDEIKNFGRQINGRIYYNSNYNLIDESDNNILTEDNIQLISEQLDKNEKTEINNELIYSMDIIKNGQLLQSLMKEFDFNAKIDLKIGTVVNAQLGLLVNNDYEYLDYGDYIIYSKQYNADNETYSYVCYDMMLYSMIKYKPLNITYPTTIKDLISAIADKMGVSFANASEEFVNYNQVVEKDLFVNQNVTYRDILDKLSEMTASNILINDDNELELGYPSETNDTINESYLKNVNVAFNEIFGPINKIAITSDSISYVKQDDASIETNGLTQINITNNLLALNGDTDTICQAILNKLKGMYYSINDFTTTGVCYYDYLDLFNVEAKDNTYKCLLLNNEIHITQGIQENIFTSKKENTETSANNFEVSTPDNKTVQFNINQQKGELESKVDKDGIISSINQSAEQIQINANKISFNGKTIDMETDDFALVSNDIKIDKNGYTLRKNGVDEGSFAILNKEITGYDCQWDDEEHKMYTTSSTTITDAVSVVDNNYLFINNFSSPRIDVQKIGVYQINGFNALLGELRFDNCEGEDLTIWGTFNNLSDKKLKDNIENMEDYTDFILNLKPKKYLLKTNNANSIGFIAQDVEKELLKRKLPTTIVNKTKDNTYTLNYIEMIPMLVQTIQKQQTTIEDLQQRISKLEKENK